MDSQGGNYSVRISENFGFAHFKQLARMIFGLPFHRSLLFAGEFLRLSRRQCLVVDSTIKRKNSFLCSVYRQVDWRSIKVRVENQEKLAGPGQAPGGAITEKKQNPGVLG